MDAPLVRTESASGLRAASITSLGPVLVAGPQVRTGPQGDDRGGVPEDCLHLLDGRAARYGIAPSAFPYVPDDQVRVGASLGAHRRWVEEVRAFGFTVTHIREEARTDTGYQTYLRRLDRRRRILETTH